MLYSRGFVYRVSFSENVYVSKSKFKWIVFELLRIISVGITNNRSIMLMGFGRYGYYDDLQIIVININLLII